MGSTSTKLAASRTAQRGQVGPVSGRTTGRSSLHGPENRRSGASQAASEPAGAGASKHIGNSTAEWMLTAFVPATVQTADTVSLPMPNPMIGQPELPLLECIDCDSLIAFIPRLPICAHTCYECGSKWIFNNGRLTPNTGVPQARVEEKRRTVLHVASMEVREEVIKTSKPVENHTVCIDCLANLQGVHSVRVSKFSHVGKRDIQESTYPYLTKTVYFPVYVKGRLCDTCCSTLTPDTKVVKDDQLIGIWRNADGVEINILIPLEVNETIDNQSMKGMDVEIKNNRESDDRNTYTLLRIDGLDEPIVLAWDYKGINKVDAQSYNAIFGKRRVNRYGRHVVEPGIGGK